MIQAINNEHDKLGTHEVYKNMQFVYNLAFFELSKQVSVHCSERGALLNDIWTAFMSLISEQLKLTQAEKGILEREAVTKIDRFHNHYESELDKARDSVLKMHKESQNYKRQYDRMIGDFNALKKQTLELGSKLQEMTILYKQQFSKADLLQRQNNNFKAQLQVLGEASEDEDKDLKPDQKKKRQLYKRPADFATGSNFTGSKNFHEFNAYQVDITRSIGDLGTNIAQIMVEADAQVEKEKEALIEADKMQQELVDEFFAD